MEEVGQDGGKVGWVHVERVGVRTTGVYGSWAASENVQWGRVGGAKTSRIVYTWLRPDGGPVLAWQEEVGGLSTGRRRRRSETAAPGGRRWGGCGGGVGVYERARYEDGGAWYRAFQDETGQDTDGRHHSS